MAAVSRSAYQIATKFDTAPVAYTLSAVAAAIYVVATIALAKGAGADRSTPRRSSPSGSPLVDRIAVLTLAFELAGVLIVGTLSLAMPEAFPAASVWSGFGAGYLYLPLLLPVLGLWWVIGPRRRGS
ncbi:MAG: hypothetical protein KGP10_07970 [Actinomycetales bacterium]|nr:hypothetical protein [Actinomycetales bacterium]